MVSAISANGLNDIQGLLYIQSCPFLGLVIGTDRKHAKVNYFLIFCLCTVEQQFGYLAFSVLTVAIYNYNSSVKKITSEQCVTQKTAKAFQKLKCWQKSFCVSTLWLDATAYIRFKLYQFLLRQGAPAYTKNLPEGKLIVESWLMITMQLPANIICTSGTSVVNKKDGTESNTTTEVS